MKKPRNKKAVIEIRGGLARVARIPKGVTLEVRDYDIPEVGPADPDPTRIRKDKSGDEYHRSVYEN